MLEVDVLFSDEEETVSESGTEFIFVEPHPINRDELSNKDIMKNLNFIN